MSQESDGIPPIREDENLDQLIQGFPNGELSGALLLEPIALDIQVPDDRHRLEQEIVCDQQSDLSSTDEIPSDDKISLQPDEPTVRDPTHHSIVRNAVNELLPLTFTVGSTVPSAPGRRRIRPGHRIVFFPEAETPKLEIDNFSDVSDEKIEFLLADRTITVAVKDLQYKTIIGEGGFGSVTKLVVNENPNISIAVKHLNIGKENRPQLRKEYTKLKTIAQNRQCPYIIDFYDALRNPLGAELCFLMELMQKNLQEAYTKLHDMKQFVKGNLDLLVRRVAYNIVSALKFMRDHGLAHNDIKPANILLDHQGHCKLADFGESDQLVDGEIPRTPTSRRPGTCYYWPPEYRERIVICSSERADLWALALTLLETSNGEHPYPLNKEDIYLKYYTKSWTPSFSLEKISQESAEFILHLFQRQSETRPSIYNDILQLSYLAGVTSDPSIEEIMLFQSII